MRTRKKNKFDFLGAGTTTDIQLSDWGYKHIPGFRGVYSRDELKRTVNSLRGGESVILNLDPEYSTGGTHWVAIRVSSEAPLVYYKDSFGGPPPRHIGEICKGCGVVYGNRINQGLKEENCGQRALIFLLSMANAARAHREIEWFRESEL